MSKGISLPVSSMVLIVIAVIALIAIISFFVMVGGGAMNRTELEKTFRQGCISICDMDDRATMNLAVKYPVWQNACEQLHGVEKGAYMQCLDFCGCLVPPRPCEYLCGFNKLIDIDGWNTFCTQIREHPSTAETYGKCDCACSND
jgi:hypothetical protein